MDNMALVCSERSNFWSCTEPTAHQSFNLEVEQARHKFELWVTREDKHELAKKPASLIWARYFLLIKWNYLSLSRPWAFWKEACWAYGLFLAKPKIWPWPLSPSPASFNIYFSCFISVCESSPLEGVSFKADLLTFQIKTLVWRMWSMLSGKLIQICLIQFELEA